jgi:hypothetical protein
MEPTTKRRRHTISKAELDAGLIYVDRGRRRPKRWVLAHNHILHASMDEVEQIFARMKPLRMSAALGLAIGFGSAAIAIYLATTIGLLMGYVSP